MDAAIDRNERKIKRECVVHQETTKLKFCSNQTAPHHEKQCSPHSRRSCLLEVHHAARDSTKHGSLPKNQNLGRAKNQLTGERICRRYYHARKESPNPGRSGEAARRSVRGARLSGGPLAPGSPGHLRAWVGLAFMIDRQQVSRLNKCLSPSLPAGGTLASFI